MAINISNSNNRDAVVAFENVVAKREVRYTDKGGGPTSNVRVLKAHAENELPVIQKKNKTLDKVAKLLIKEDPEVDLEKVGMFLTDTSRVYVSQSGILHLVEEFELIYKTDGEIANRRPKEKKPQNVTVKQTQDGLTARPEF